jgi:uncharacterized protein YbjT (DUF2867 family)
MATVLVVGATGHLGGKAVDALLAQGHSVRALVRDAAAASSLGARGVELAVGDLNDRASLDRACAGCDAVVSTANGFFRRRGETPQSVDADGHRNLVAAAQAAGVRRFVLTSVLNAQLAKDVLHFIAKTGTETLLRESGMEWVSLRPGSFIDQRDDRWAPSLKKGALEAMGDPDRKITYVPTSEIARCLALAVAHPDASGKTIDLGCDRPASPNDLVALFSTVLGKPVKLRALPLGVATTVMGVIGLFKPMVKDLRAMLQFIFTQPYVADTTLQTELFGPPPKLQDALRAYARDAGLLG